MKVKEGVSADQGRVTFALLANSITKNGWNTKNNKSYFIRGSYDTFFKENGTGINVITVARVTNEATKIKTQEFCNGSGFVFPTLMDEDQDIASLYQVTSTPTIVVIRPDGVIDSVILSSDQDFGKTMEQKKKLFL